MGLLILYLLIALSISFLCSILEAVLLSTPMSFITMKEKEGAKSAALFKKLKHNIDRPISAILSLNTIAHTVGAAGVGAEAVKVFGEAYFGVISAILTIAILIFSEIIPKTIGARFWRSLAMGSAPVMQVLIYITYPLVILSDFITRLFSSNKEETTVSREEISAMVTVGTEEGVFEMKESKIIQNVFKLENIKVREIMTPNVVVESAPESLTLREFYQNKSYSNYSRIPVYKEDRDYISGYVLRQTVLEYLTEDKFDVKLGDIVRPVLSGWEGESVSNVWERMLEKNEHLSVLIDEYGCFRGIVTMEDIIETLLGLEIVDEKDIVPDMQILAKEKWQKLKRVQFNV